jgi:hypothetical protein
MAEGDETSSTFSLNLDIEDFKQNASQALDSVNSLAESIESMADLSGSLTSMAGTVGIMALAFEEVKTAADAIFEGEKIEQLNTQFETLARNAGVMSTELKEGLQQSSQGWVDETSLIQAANKAMVGLETGVDQLPALMSLAQKATQVMGGTAIDNFNAIAKAVETGSTRQLRALGIIVDQQTAYRDFAKSIGVTVDSLNQAGKQQAVLNAVLDQGNKKFAAVAPALTTATSQWNQLKATLNDFKDTVIIVFEQTWGPLFEKFLGGIKTAVQWVSNLYKAGNQKLGILDDVKQTTVGMGDLLQAERQSVQVEQTRAELQNKFTDRAKATKDAAAAEKELEAIEKQITAAEISDMDNVKDATLLYYTQMVQGALDVKQQIDQVNAKVAAGTLSATQGKQQIAKLNQLMDKKIEQDDDAMYKMQEQALDNYVRHSETAYDGVARAFQSTALKNKHAMADMGQFGTNAVAAFSDSATSNIEAFGAGTKSATQAVEGMFAGMAGKMASQYGSMMMLASIWPPNPAGFAAGVALVALGGMLSSLGGSSSSSSSTVATVPSAGGAAGGDLAVGNSIANPTTPVTAAQQQTQQSVSINIQGNYYDNQQFQQSLIQMIREQQDATQFNINQIGSG